MSSERGELVLIWIMGGLLLLGLGFILYGVYMIFSPKYNIAEDYRAILPIFGGAIIWGVDLVILLAWGMYQAVVR